MAKLKNEEDRKILTLTNQQNSHHKWKLKIVIGFFTTQKFKSFFFTIQSPNPSQNTEKLYGKMGNAHLKLELLLHVRLSLNRLDFWVKKGLDENESERHENEKEKDEEMEMEESKTMGKCIYGY